MRTQAFIFGFFLLSPLLACEGEEHTEQIQVPGDLERLVIDTGAGDIAVYGDDCEWVEVYVEMSRDAELDWEVDGKVLYIDPDCVGLACASDFFVTVPFGVEVEVSTGAGDVKVADMRAGVWIDTGAGDVDLERLSGRRLEVDTGSGDVQGRRLSVEKVRLDTGAGDVDAVWSDAPGSLLVDTGAGDVDLSLPHGDYDIDVDTGVGKVDIQGLGRDSASPHRVRVDTGAGDVTLRGH